MGSNQVVDSLCPIRYATTLALNSPKNMNSGSESLESEQKMESQETSATDNATEKSDGFVIDVETFSSGGSINKDSNSNSRITLQRSVSKKGRSDKKVNVPAAALRHWDAIPASCSPLPRGFFVGGMPEKMVVPVVGSGDNCGSPRFHHQITVTTATMSGEAKSMARRNSFKRPSNNWGLDPWKVFLFFATLSIIGSILLIYFTFMTSDD